MSVGREEIERIAALARLDVDAAALPALTAQIGRILDYVATLAAAVPARDADVTPHLTGAPHQLLREDEVRPPDLALPPGAVAPAFDGTFFLVPRLEALDQE